MAAARTVALVETATQLHNVVEWAHAQQAVDEIRVNVLAPPDRESVRQLTQVATLARGLGVDVRHRAVRTRSTAALTGAAAVAADVRRAQRLVIGDAFSRYIHTLLPLFRAPEVVLVDDGTSTWEFVSCLDAGRPMIRWTLPSDRPERRQLRATRLLTPGPQRRLTVFSCLADATPRGATRLDNTYGWARSWSTPDVVDARVDILGISLVDSAVIERRAYVDAVASLARRYGTARYVAHRRESAALVAEIGTLPGVSIARFDLPAELALRQGPVSERIVTFPSTASHTLPIVLADLIDRDAVRVGVRAVDPAWFTPSATQHAREFVARIADTAPRDPRVTVAP